MASLPFNDEAVRALAAILTETGLTEIEIEGKEGRIRVARAPATIAAVATAAPAIVAAPAKSGPAAAAPSEEAPEAGAIPSPMVGIAYLSPEPGAPPYVNVGQSVVAGQTVMLIEAMKTFNQIKAPHAGTITRILVGAGSPVEFGQSLLVIDPS